MEYFRSLSKRNYKFKPDQFKSNLDKLDGEGRCLTDGEIKVLIGVLTQAKLSSMLHQKLLCCMVPDDIISASNTKSLLCWILSCYRNVTKGKVIFTLQWLVALLEMGLFEKEIIDAFYFQYFFMLNELKLEKLACRLIYMLTTPYDITRMHVEWLIQMRSINLKARHIEALLSLFKTLRPELVPERVKAGNIYSAFGRLPVLLLEAIDKRRGNRPRTKVEIRMIGIHEEEMGQVDEIDDENEEEHFIVEQPKKKKKLVSSSLIPQTTYINFGSKLYSDTKEVTLRDFKRVEVLACHLPSVLAPNQSISLLGDEMGRTLILFDQTGELQWRISYNLTILLDEVYIYCRRSCSLLQKRQFLQCLASFQDLAHQAVPVVSKFVKDYLKLWEGGNCLAQVLQLMHWLHFESNAELMRDFMPPLYTLFVSSGIKVKCAILRTLGQLFSNIVVTARRQGYAGILFGITEKWEPCLALHTLLEFASSLITQGLNDGRALGKLRNQALTFFEQVVAIIEVSNMNFHFELPPVLVFSCFFTLDITALSRICGLLDRCSHVLNADSAPGELVHIWTRNEMLLCSYYSEILNALDGKLFQSEDGFFHQRLSEKCRDDLHWLTSRFDLSHHPAIVLAAHNLQPIRGLGQQTSPENILLMLQQYFPQIYKFLQRRM